MVAGRFTEGITGGSGARDLLLSVLLLSFCNVSD